jgi:hypothetical protein
VTTYRERIYTAYQPSYVRDPVDDARTNLSARTAHLSHAIDRLLPKDRNSKIVDLGSGYGAFVSLATDAGYRDVSGYDRSSLQLAAARGLGIEGIESGDLLQYRQYAG